MPARPPFSPPVPGASAHTPTPKTHPSSRCLSARPSYPLNHPPVRPAAHSLAYPPTRLYTSVARVAQPTSAKVAVLNAQSIGNKFAAICDRITVENRVSAPSWRHGTTRPTAPASSHVRPLATIALRELARVQQPKSTACLPTMEVSVYYTRLRGHVWRPSSVAASL